MEVDVSEYFPMGVKTTYRAFAQDEVVEIIKSPFPPDTFSGQIIGLKAIKTEVHDYPRDNPSGRPDGMYILKKLPSTLLRPRPMNTIRERVKIGRRIDPKATVFTRFCTAIGIESEKMPITTE